jgi:hypothetical protein
MPVRPIDGAFDKQGKRNLSRRAFRFYNRRMHDHVENWDDADSPLETVRGPAARRILVGVGLARGIGGDLVAESTRGAGSTFEGIVSSDRWCAYHP